MGCLGLTSVTLLFHSLLLRRAIAAPGSIQDPAGAILRGAIVIARHVANGSVSQTTTTATGNFTLPAPPARALRSIGQHRGI
jgi:hypothetical protein